MFNVISEKFSSIFSKLTGSSSLTEKNIAEVTARLQDSLIDADVPYAVVESFIAQVKDDVLGKKVISSVKPAELFIKIVYDRLKQLLSGDASSPDTLSFSIPSVLMFVGLQGSGKTTTIGKVAYYLKSQAEAKRKNRKILLASVDFYRPAAVEQLSIVAQKVGVDFFKAVSDKPLEAAREILVAYKAGGYEHLLLDTAGRLHVDDVLMNELHRLIELVKPRYKILVLDAMTGQQSLVVAESFQTAIGFDGAILSKMDSDAKAGSALAFRYVLNKPILAVGVGEHIEDLQYFKPDRVANRLIGLGDLESLLEKAQQKISAREQEVAAQRLLAGDFTYNDFLQQLSMVNRLGSLQSLMGYLPGAASVKLTPEQVEQGERDIKRFKAIIQSMTLKERSQPGLLNPSRKRRIALGAGVQEKQVDQLVERFEQSRQFVKLLKKNGLFNSLLRKSF